MKVAGILRKASEFYGGNIMIRKWGRAFEDSSTNAHDVERSGFRWCGQNDRVLVVAQSGGRIL